MPDGLQDLIDALAGSVDPLDAVDILGRFCIDRKKDLARFTKDAEGRRILNEVRAFVASMSQTLTLEVKSVADTIEAAGAELVAVPAAVVAQAVLVQFTRQHGHAIDGHLTQVLESGPCTLSEGQVLPRPEPRFDARFKLSPLPIAVAADLCTHPGALHRAEPLGPSNTHAVGQFPAFVTEVVLRAAHLDRALDQGWPTFGAVQPVASSEVKGLRQTYPEGSDGFVVVRDAEAAKSSWERALDVAADLGVHVLVGPEFMAPEQVATVSTAGGEVPIVLAGSRHEQAASGPTSPYRNAATLYVNGKPVLEHTKLVPFQNQHMGPESIEAGSSLSVVHGEGWRIAVLICSDVNSDVLTDFVSTLSPNMVLVPSWTYSAGVFPERLAHLGASCRAFTLFVNGPIFAPEAAGAPQVTHWRPFRPSSEVRVAGPLDTQMAIVGAESATATIVAI